VLDCFGVLGKGCSPSQSEVGWQMLSEGFPSRLRVEAVQALGGVGLDGVAKFVTEG